jgi:hypothetical protein
LKSGARARLVFLETVAIEVAELVDPAQASLGGV